MKHSIQSILMNTAIRPLFQDYIVRHYSLNLNDEKYQASIFVMLFEKSNQRPFRRTPTLQKKSYQVWKEHLLSSLCITSSGNE